MRIFAGVWLIFAGKVFGQRDFFVVVFHPSLQLGNIHALFLLIDCHRNHDMVVGIEILHCHVVFVGLFRRDSRVVQTSRILIPVLSEYSVHRSHELSKEIYSYVRTCIKFWTSFSIFNEKLLGNSFRRRWQGRNKLNFWLPRQESRPLQVLSEKIKKMYTKNLLFVILDENSWFNRFGSVNLARVIYYDSFFKQTNIYMYICNERYTIKYFCLIRAVESMKKLPTTTPTPIWY